MGKKKSITVGYRYFFDIFMGLCRGPVDDLVEIRVGDRTAWHGSVAGTDGSFSIDAYDLFGGEKAEGGIKGNFHLHVGSMAQTRIPGLEKLVGAPRPAFRHRVTAFYSGMISAMNPYPKPWAFRLRRTVAGWDGGVFYKDKATIIMTRPTTPSEVTSSAEIHAMNGAHIVYEALTNRDWGRGLDTSLLDVSSFASAADRLHSEGFGLCLRWTRRDTLDAFVSSVLDHISATLYNDPSTGLMTLKLIRFDYDRESLPLFDVDTGLMSIEEAPVSALGPTVNEVTVTFRDPITNKDMTVGVQNLASIQASGGAFNSINREFPGIPTPELALRVAQRELRSKSVGLRRFKVTLDRRAWRLVPGGVFRIRDLARGIPDTVLRIGRIDKGTLLNGQIRLDAVNDVFSFPLSSYAAPSYPPDRPRPIPKPAENIVFEVPYFLLAGASSRADLAHMPDEVGYLGVLAIRPNPMHGGYDIAVRDGAPTPDEYVK